MKLEETIRILYDAGVEFVVIGGVAMGLQGSAHLTKDIDFCYARTTKNMERLARALEPFHPVLRGAPPGLPFRFDAKTIANGLNFTLSTDLGDLDFLGEVSGLGLFQDVLGTSDVKDVGGVDCRVLSLEGLIKSKTAAGRPRDLYVLPELRGLNEIKKKTGLE
jgi:predicted nucleotidyltransferase